MRLTDATVLRGLWLLLALTSPFFGVEFLRYNNEALRIHLAIPTVVHFAIVTTLFLGVLMRGGRFKRPEVLARKWGRLLFVLVTAFLVWHVIGLARAFDFAYAGREVIKLGLGFLTFLTVAGFFPRDEQFLERFWQLAIWGAAGLLGYLIYLHGFVFMSPQLAGTDRLGREGANQLTGQVVVVMPYAIAWLWGARHKVAVAVPLLVITAAWIYAGSRAAWIAVLISLVVMAFELRKRLGWRGVVSLALAIVVIGGASLWALDKFMPTEHLDFVSRAQYIYDPESVPELQTYEDRSERIVRALECCAVTSPLIGVGLTNTQAFSGLPHNEYVSILGDLGLVGLVLFALILYAIFRCSWLGWAPSDGAAVWWVASGTHAVFAAVVIFFLTIDKFYTVQTFWVFAGLALVTREIERRGVRPPSRRRWLRVTGRVRIPPLAQGAGVVGD